MAKKENYENNIGKKLYNEQDLYFQICSFNHIMRLNQSKEDKIFSSKNIEGSFVYNSLTGDMYCISEYGITNFNYTNLIWHLNESTSVDEFLKINKRISDNYGGEPPVSKTRERMGL